MQHDETRRFGAATSHTEQQAHAELGNPRFIQDVHTQLCLSCNGRCAVGKYARRQRVTWFVREPSRHVARLTTHAAAVGRFTCRFSCVLWGARFEHHLHAAEMRRRIVAGLVLRRIKIREYETLDDCLHRVREMLRVGPDDGHAFVPTLPCREGSRCRKPTEPVYRVVRAAAEPMGRIDQLTVLSNDGASELVRNTTRTVAEASATVSELRAP